jgi:Uma2 family endonuclease
VEVISESDTALDIERKIQQYLRAGATATWTFYPDTRTVMVRRKSGETRMLGPGQTIEEPDLFPGLKIPVDQIFKL